MGIRSALCVPIKARKLTDKHRRPGHGRSSTSTAQRQELHLRPRPAPPADGTIGLQAGLAIQNTKLYQQGLQAERLAAVGETTAALSHSIKNILQALRGGADVVEMGFKSQPT